MSAGLRQRNGNVPWHDILTMHGLLNSIALSSLRKREVNIVCGPHRNDDFIFSKCDVGAVARKIDIVLHFRVKFFMEFYWVRRHRFGTSKTGELFKLRLWMNPSSSFQKMLNSAIWPMALICVGDVIVAYFYFTMYEAIVCQFRGISVVADKYV